MSGRGNYIVIEGNDGTGKTTQATKVHERLAANGVEVVEFHEPAGTPIVDAIRVVLKNGELARDNETDLLLFTAARHEIWLQIEQELERGKWVVAVRNYYSSLAYQGYGEGLDLDVIKQTTRSFTGDRYMTPDLAIILSLNDEAREQRITQRGETRIPDAFESRSNDFQSRVNDGYLRIAATQDIPVVDASGTLDEVEAAIWQHVEPLIT